MWIGLKGGEGDKQVGEWVDGWISRWTDGWMNGWVDGWMDGFYTEHQGFHLMFSASGTV